MTTSNQLLMLMKSELQLSSVQGEGSDFFFSIIFEKVIELVERIKEMKEQGEINMNQCRVLIADDNAVNRFLLVTLIKRNISNAYIIETQNGEEAIKFANQQSFDINGHSNANCKWL